MFDKKYPIIGTHFAEAVKPVDFDKIKYMKRTGEYGLTSAHILYRMPDHQDFLQSFIWQDYDRTPKFPALNKFIQFWQKNLDGPIHSVTVSHKSLIAPAEYRSVVEFGLN